MKAITREEKIMSGENLTPITRKEMFLAKLVGQEIETPSPITRVEKIMNGDKLTPTTREEIFVARASGQEIKAPTPITRKEIFLNEISQKEPTYHTIRFLSEGIVLQESILAYGEMPVYFGEEPTKTDHKFVGWTPDIAVVTGDVDYVAQFRFDGSVARTIISKTITEYSNDTVKSIGDYAFYCSKQLASVNIPNVTSIGKHAFNSCSNLVSVHLPATPPSVQSNSFTSIKSTCVFYVPTGSLATYQANGSWSTYVNQYSFVEEDR
jgi:hypothetical protein